MVYTTSELHTGIQDFHCVWNRILPHVCVGQLSLYDTFNLIKACAYRLLHTLWIPETTEPESCSSVQAVNYWWSAAKRVAEYLKHMTSLTDQSIIHKLFILNTSTNPFCFHFYKHRSAQGVQTNLTVKIERDTRHVQNGLSKANNRDRHFSKILYCNI